jgi:hypothetical protein
MGRQRYSLQLTRKQQAYLTDFISSETISRQQRNRAQVLQHWLTDMPAQESGELLGLSIDRVYSMRRAFSQQGFNDYLHAVPRCGAPTKLTPKLESLLRRLMRGPAPANHRRWTLPLLAQRVVEMGYTERICTITVQKALKQMSATTLRTGALKSAEAPCALKQAS